MKKIFGVLAALLFLTEGQALALPFTMQSPTSADDQPSEQVIHCQNSPEQVPEPGTMLLFGTGLVGLYRLKIRLDRRMKKERLSA